MMMLNQLFSLESDELAMVMVKNSHNFAEELSFELINVHNQHIINA